MWLRLTSRLYVRIWLAVVATVVVLGFAAAGIWQMTREPREPPVRDIVVRNKAGDIIATAQTKPGRRLGELEFDVVTSDGLALNLLLPRSARPAGGGPQGRPFLSFGFSSGWMLALVGLAVALGSYPIIRRLTVRLEALQSGVERWGAGDLSIRLNADGNDEVAFLAQRFNQAAQRIETLMNSHKTLLANASHELRSPLTRIRMSLELMGGNAALPQRIEILRSITELDQLIDEVLLASRLDTRQADPEPFEQLDLTGLAAEECVRAHAELVLSATGQSLLVQGSPRLLRRLVRNLLENANRYGRANGSKGDVSVELTHKREGMHDFAVIAVHDRGPGVPLALREQIFEAFYRLPGTSEHQGSVGLGLALVKSISQRHGGTARCEARAGGGAIFVVEIPVSQPVALIHR